METKTETYFTIGATCQRGNNTFMGGDLLSGDIDWNNRKGSGPDHFETLEEALGELESLVARYKSEAGVYGDFCFMLDVRETIKDSNGDFVSEKVINIKSVDLSRWD